MEESGKGLQRSGKGSPMEEKRSNGGRERAPASTRKHSRHAQQRHTEETVSGAKTAVALRAAPVSSVVVLLSVVIVVLLSAVVSTPGVFDR
jgi:hypothetical protein